jgi:hypothetical protein
MITISLFAKLMINSDISSYYTTKFQMHCFFRIILLTKDCVVRILQNCHSFWNKILSQTNNQIILLSLVHHPS